MTYIRLGNFFQVYKVRDDGSFKNEGRYNNITPGQSVSWEGNSYSYLSFIYQGAAKNRTGDNLEAQLMLSANEISMGLAREAVTENYHIEMNSASVSPTGSIIKVLTNEVWIAASMTYDVQTLEVILSSGIDAVGANAPTRVLTREMVGNLPVTAAIRTA